MHTDTDGTALHAKVDDAAARVTREHRANRSSDPISSWWHTSWISTVGRDESDMEDDRRGGRSEGSSTVSSRTQTDAHCSTVSGNATVAG